MLYVAVPKSKNNLLFGDVVIIASLHWSSPV